jgi:nitronate monooxygenase
MPVPEELDHPIVQAPLAGGPSTPALAAAVSEAGGLGFLAAGYKTPEAVAAEVAEVRALTTAPFGLNLFVVSGYEPDAAALDDYRRSLEPEAARLGPTSGSPGGTTTTGRPRSTWRSTYSRTSCRSRSAARTPRCSAG